MKPSMICLILLMAFVGCTTKSNARKNARAAFAVGRRSAVVEAQQTGIFFQGEVRNPLVKWSEGLTLSRAVLAADWIGAADPKGFVISRKGEKLTVESRDLLDGKTDPFLLPGDVVDVLR